MNPDTPIGPATVARNETVCDECTEPIRPGHLIIPIGDIQVHLGCFKMTWTRL